MKVTNNAILVVHSETTVGNLRAALEQIDKSDLTDASRLRVFSLKGDDGLTFGDGSVVRADQVPPQGVVIFGELEI